MLYLKGSRPLTPTGRTPTLPASPPFFHQGAFNQLLPFFVKLVTSQMEIAVPTEDLKKQWMGEIAALVLKRMRIDFLPWSPGERPTPDGWARWNSFVMLSGAGPSHPVRHHVIIIDDLSEEEIDVGGGLPAAGGLSSAAGSSSVTTLGATQTNAWSPSTLPLLQLRSHLGVHHIPTEIARLQADATSSPPIVRACYLFLVEHYDKNNKVHHLALIMSWVFCKMAPCYMLQARKGSGHVTAPAWSSEPNSVRRPYGPGVEGFGWWFIFILSVLDENSPLRVRMLAAGQGKRRSPFGADWVDNMSE